MAGIPGALLPGRAAAKSAMFGLLENDDMNEALSENKPAAHELRRDPVKQLRNALRRRAMDKVYAPKAAPVIYPMRTRFSDLYPKIASTIGANASLTYLEFGVWKGASIKRMAATFTNPEARFFGFDSFVGLPEAWGKVPSGKFSVEGELPETRDDRITFIKGYFQNTLPSFVKDTLGARPAGPVLVNFDADLYSSTLFLLTMLWQHVPEYYFVFDEFPGDEAVALHDFSSAYPVDFTFFAGVESHAGPTEPMQVFGRMKNIAFELS